MSGAGLFVQALDGAVLYSGPGGVPAVGDYLRLPGEQCGRAYPVAFVEWVLGQTDSYGAPVLRVTVQGPWRQTEAGVWESAQGVPS